MSRVRSTYVTPPFVFEFDDPDDAPTSRGFVEHRVAGGTLFVPAGAKLHDVPFGFTPTKE